MRKILSFATGLGPKLVAERPAQRKVETIRELRYPYSTWRAGMLVDIRLCDNYCIGEAMITGIETRIITPIDSLYLDSTQTMRIWVEKTLRIQFALLHPAKARRDYLTNFPPTP